MKTLPVIACLVAAFIIPSLQASTAPDAVNTSAAGKYIVKNGTDYFELNADGTFSAQLHGKQKQGVYKIEGDTITLRLHNELKKTSYRLSGGAIYSLETGDLILQRQQDAHDSATKSEAPQSPAPTAPSPSNPAIGDLAASLSREIPLAGSDQIVEKRGSLVTRRTYDIESAALMDCRLTLQTASRPQIFSEAGWAGSAKSTSGYTLPLNDVDTSRLRAGEYEVGQGATFSKPSYYVELNAIAGRGQPFLLETQHDVSGTPTKKTTPLGTVRIRVRERDAATALAAKLRSASILCGAPDVAVATTAPAPTAANASPSTDKSSMTNTEVVALVSAGLSDDVVMTAIRQAPSKHFDVTPMGLLALKKAHVSDGIISTMQSSAETSKPAPASADAPAPKYDASLANVRKPAPAPTAAQGCDGVEMMGVFQNEIFDRAMGGGVVEWVVKIRNNTGVTKIVGFGWIDSYGQEQRSQAQIRGGDIASLRVDLTQAKMIAPVRDAHLVSCQ